MVLTGDLMLFVTAFSLITLAEMGDKTQFSVITLGTRYPAFSVMGGSILAFALVNGIAVIAGVFIVTILPVFWVKIGVASLFLAFGGYTLYGLKKQDAKQGSGDMRDNKGTGDTGNKKETGTTETGGKNGFISSFSLIFLMELGDKTQIATATLVAGYGRPFVVFAGVLLGLSILTVLEVKLGSVISKKIRPERMELIAGVVFILFGILTLVEAFFTGL